MTHYTLLLQKCILPSLILFIISIAIVITIVIIITIFIIVMTISIIIVFVMHGRYVKSDNVLPQFLRHMVSDVKFLHTFFYLAFLCSKATTSYELK